MNPLPFPTSDAQLSKLPSFLNKMFCWGFSKEFLWVVEAVASKDQGMFELVEMWSQHSHDYEEQAMDVVAIRATLKDYGYETA